MKIAAALIFISLAFLSCESNGKLESAENIVGDYQLFDPEEFTGADLRLRFLDENAYLVQLNEAAGVGKLKKGILKGTFKNKYGEGSPFTLKVTGSQVCIVRVNNRTLSFIKKS